jgi:hypothetical protein
MDLASSWYWNITAITVLIFMKEINGKFMKSTNFLPHISHTPDEDKMQNSEATSYKFNLINT